MRSTLLERKKLPKIECDIFMGHPKMESVIFMGRREYLFTSECIFVFVLGIAQEKLDQGSAVRLLMWVSARYNLFVGNCFTFLATPVPSN